MPDDGTVLFEDAHVIWQNFAGVEGPMNAEGHRNFCVVLSEEDAARMAADGWNVKYRTPPNPDDEPFPYIQVTVGYKYLPPRVVIISSRGRTPLDQTMVSLLDQMDVRTWDVIIRPRVWERNGRSGVKAYLKTLFAILNEDDLEKKYAHIPEIGSEGGDPE
jgi:hypothetical protein